MLMLFVVDPLHTFKIYKDTSYAMMREAFTRGHTLYTCTPDQISWQTGGKICAVCEKIELKNIDQTDPQFAHDWYKRVDVQTHELHEFDAILMRKDPPFDSEFFYCTHLLGQAQREGASVFNHPAALREHPEKLAIMEFAQYAPPTLVSRDPEQIRAFHAKYKDIILKPLDGMGGMGIFRITENAMNLGSAMESLNEFGRRTIMVQQYLPAIVQGDKRVPIIDGEPIPYALARMPQGNEVRGNLAAGGKGVAQPLSEEDRVVAQSIGRVLAPRGLHLIGLDMIGNTVTEINVTSPTGFQEIKQQTGFDVAAAFIDSLEKQVQNA